MESICQKDAEKMEFFPLSDEQTQEIKCICGQIIDGGMQTASYRITGQEVTTIKEKDGRVRVKRVRKIEREAL